MTRNLTALVATLISIQTSVGCGDAGLATEGGFEASEHSQAIIETYGDEVVVTNYELLARRVGELGVAVQTLAADPSTPHLDAAQDAWIAAREPWEQGEAYLFGPVDSEGFDPALDSWPVNRTDLDAVLASGDDLTTDYVANLDPTVQGFHTAEYLLFGVERTREAEELTARELEYLVAVTAGMEAVSSALVESWTRGENGGKGYARVFRTAGEPDNRVYPSRTAAAQEMVFGIIGILDEVANGKIADPFVEQDVRLVESQFSFNSLRDFADNIISAENAYLGRNPETAELGVGFAVFVAAHDAALDDRIRDEFADVLSALRAIPEPFRAAILDADSGPGIEAAQVAIRTLLATFQGDVLPLLGG